MAYGTYLAIRILPHSSSYLDCTYWGSTNISLPLGIDNCVYTYNEEQLALSLAVTSSDYDFEDINPTRLTIEEYGSSETLYLVAWWNINTTHSASNPDVERIVDISTFEVW